MSPEALPHSPRFDLTTSAYRLRTSGVARRVRPTTWNGPAVAEAVERTLRDARAAAGGGGEPIVVGAIPFDPSREALLHVPEHVSWGGPPEPVRPPRTGRGRRVRLDDDDPHYRRAVAAAVQRIRGGELDKVVLARRATAHREDPFDVNALHASLAAANPSAYAFRFDLPEQSPGAPPTTLLGASPELVLSSSGGLVESHPLAGSTPRRDDPDDDRAVAQALLGSAKARGEHGHVVRAVAQAFERLATDVHVPDAPSLLSTPVIWHLGTRITGRLRPGASPLELAYAMHPTPAVCGWPAGAARRMIGELEDFDRGLYSGLVGWIDAEGNSEWALTLRCAEVHGATATLYAGAGIVSASDPDDEHEETDVKLSTFLHALESADDPVPVA
ncbi:MAG: isochorismate synthase [Microbacterium gubbeenense]|uniref:isochorismate synthase n=1 Tax=Microbacterium gubbeenense TaxID=159896 RepID=UPI003F99160C